jgi:hypothetical protein
MRAICWDAAQFGFGVDAGQVRKGVEYRQRDVLAHAQVGNDALALAVLGHHAQPGADGFERRARVDHLAVEPDLGAVATGVGAEQAETSSVRPAPTSPAMPRISPRLSTKEMSSTRLRRGCRRRSR